MEFRKELADLRDLYIGAISEAASDQNSERIVQLSDRLRAIEADISSLANLERRIAEHTDALNGTTPTPIKFFTIEPAQPPEQESPRARGNRLRREFAASHDLIPEKGVVYKTRAGRRVGVATGSKEFLGLPDTTLDVAVLLCDSSRGEKEFVIPMSSLGNVWPQLSRSRGQVKLNLNVDEGRLNVPDHGPVDISRFADRFDLLN